MNKINEPNYNQTNINCKSNFTKKEQLLSKNKTRNRRILYLITNKK